MPADSTTELQPAAGMPKGIGNAYVFQVFNTISFSIVLGLPMILYCKHLGASATILGIVAALPPLLVTLQIPAAQFVERVGYRAFVLWGWTARSYVILGIAAAVLLPARIDAPTKIGLILFLLFLFNASRGISLCGFLPWMTQLVPEAVRGQYLSRDQMCGALAFLGTGIVNALFVTGADSDYAFAAMFAGSFVAAQVSLWFLRRVPDVPVARDHSGRGMVPWQAMLRFPPFRRLVIYNVVMCSAFAAAGIFWVPFLRDYHQASDGKILAIGAVGNAVAVGSLAFFGAIIDRVGSRPLLTLSGLAFVGHFALWGALAGGVQDLTWGAIAVMQVLAGVGGSLFNLANTRLAMATVPAVGRSHYFALFSVIQNLTLGLLPIAWGIALDSLREWRWSMGAWEWNPYSLMYLVLTITMGAGLYFRGQLTEPRAMTTEAFFRELLVQTPSRALSRLLARRPFS